MKNYLFIRYILFSTCTRGPSVKLFIYILFVIFVLLHLVRIQNIFTLVREMHIHQHERNKTRWHDLSRTSLPFTLLNEMQTMS